MQCKYDYISCPWECGKRKINNDSVKVCFTTEPLSIFQGYSSNTSHSLYNAIQVVKSMNLTHVLYSKFNAYFDLYSASLVQIDHICKSGFILTINIQFHSIHDFTLFDKWITRPTSKPFADVLHLRLIRENTNSSISITRGLKMIINLIILCVIKI